MKFVYLSNETEVTWNVDLDNSKFHLVYIGESVRYEIRQWIEDSCSGKVFVWHGSSNVMSASSYTTTTLECLMPSKICAMIFTDPEDESMFFLAWSHMLSSWGYTMTTDWHTAKHILINGRRM